MVPFTPVVSPSAKRMVARPMHEVKCNLEHLERKERPRPPIRAQDKLGVSPNGASFNSQGQTEAPPLDDRRMFSKS